MPQGIAKERPGNESRPFPLLQASRPWTYPPAAVKSKSFSEKWPYVMGSFKNMATFVEK